MRDLFGHDDRHWYSLISASPMPESGERVNVGVLVGNGRVTALRYLDHLPRLCGIAAADEVTIYAAVLKVVSEMVRSSAMKVESVQGFLAPQLALGEPRELARVPDDALLERLVDRFLAAPKQPTKEQNLDALVTKSIAKLDKQLQRARPKGVMIESDIRPKSLYQGKLDKHIAFHVPKLARAFRGFDRDALLDSLVVERGHEAAVVREVASRIGQAFFVYEKLKKTIRRQTQRELRLVGVLQPSAPDATPDTLALREYILETWRRDAEVIDGNTVDIEEELRSVGKWAGSTAA